MHSSSPVWRLKKGFDRRFQSGHPWVFSNELQSSPKGIAPGASVELQDASGGFLAHGFGNPSSLIAFREVSRNPADADWDSEVFLEQRLRDAYRFRIKLGLEEVSFRWIHGESDGFSGLIVDRYVLSSGEVVLVLQCHSSGMDRVSEKLVNALLRIETAAKKVVLRNDLSTRKLEGLTESITFPKGELLGETQTIFVRGWNGQRVPFTVDLKGGQKTGFFLDQTDNIQSVLKLMIQQKSAPSPIRVLDLCTYVGQWSAQFAAALKSEGLKAEFSLVDISEKALKLARKNVEAFGFPVKSHALDVLKDLEELEENKYDVVICDPPALIQNRKHIPQGIHAYQKLNRDALKRLAGGGLFVSCSCSQLLSPLEFQNALAKAEKSSKSKMAWVLQGAQAIDHPIRMDFPEAHYLKMQVGFKTGIALGTPHSTKGAT
jgi:23S rRNA (cytosine1962-C5)-methyltransferase